MPFRSAKFDDDGPDGRSRRSLRPPLPAASAPFLWAATAVAVGHGASGQFAGEDAVENAQLCLRCFRICLQRRKWPWRRLGKLLHLRCLVDDDACRLAACSLASLLSIPTPGTNLSCSQSTMCMFRTTVANRLWEHVACGRSVRPQPAPACSLRFRLGEPRSEGDVAASDSSDCWLY